MFAGGLTAAGVSVSQVASDMADCLIVGGVEHMGHLPMGVIGLNSDDLRVNKWGGVITYCHPLAASGSLLATFFVRSVQGKSKCQIRYEYHVCRSRPWVFDDLGMRS